MKIAVCSNNNNIESEVSDFFARSPYFLIVEIKDNQVAGQESLENTTGQQVSGAGISAAKLMAENQVSAVITKNLGPRALDVLNQFDIQAYQGQGKIKPLIDQFIKGQLEAFS